MLFSLLSMEIHSLDEKSRYPTILRTVAGENSQR
jgi:hypothetical protein